MIDENNLLEVDLLLGEPPSVRSAAIWNVGGMLTSRVLVLTFGVVLARILPPRDFGLVALATAVVSLGAILSDLGLGAALIHRQGDVRENASAAFFMNLVGSVIVTILLVIVAGPVSGFYDQPDVRLLLYVMIAGFALRAATLIHEAYIRKRLRYRTLQLINLSSIGAQGVVAVGLALAGFGAWSLAFGLLAQSVVYSGAILFLSGMPLSRSPHLERWRGLAIFSGLLYVAGLFWAVDTNIDNLAVGKVLGAGALGVYAAAYGYGMLPSILVGTAVSDVMFSAMSPMQEDLDRLNGALAKGVRVLAAVSVPIGAVLLFAGAPLFTLVLGPQWTDGAAAFGVFATVFAFIMFTSPYPAVYLALGRSKVNLAFAAGALPVVLVGLAIGLQFGITGTAIGVATAMVLISAAHLPVIKHLTGFPVMRMLAEVYPAFASAALALAVAFLLSAVRTPLGDWSWLLPALAVPFLYAGILRVIFPRLWRELAGEVGRLLRRNADKTSSGVAPS